MSRFRVKLQVSWLKPLVSVTVFCTQLSRVLVLVRLFFCFLGNTYFPGINFVSQLS